jgi:hypothetical protein
MVSVISSSHLSSFLRDAVSGRFRPPVFLFYSGGRCYIIPKISTKGSTGVPPKLSHKPSGNVRHCVLPGNFRKGGCGRRVLLGPSSMGQPRNHASPPLAAGFTPGGRCGHCLRRCLICESNDCNRRMALPDKLVKRPSTQPLSV